MDDRPKKRIRITANNGHNVMRGTKHSRRKNVPEPSSTPARRIGVKGRLAALPSLPLDVLFEILGHLLPRDILHLTRLTKDFRHLLLHKSAISIWKAALANIPDLPECPRDMSLPAWSSLVFDVYCHSCWTPNIRNFDFILRVRLCGKCAKRCLIRQTAFDENCKKDKIILRCIPFSTWPGRTPRFAEYCTSKAKDAFVRKLQDPECDRQELVDEKKAEMKIRSEHGKRCRQWFDSFSEGRVQVIEDTRRKRKQAITEKLEGLGYQTELSYLADKEFASRNSWPPPGICLLHEHPSFKVPKLLSERMWANMKCDMVDYMEDVRAYRLQEERLSLIEERKAMVLEAWSDYRQENFTTVTEFMPSPVDIIEWPLVKSIVTLPSETQVMRERISMLFDASLTDFIKSWRDVQFERLLSRSELPWASHLSPTERLQLAVNVYRCNGGIVHKLERSYGMESYHCSLWYPEFLHHQCNTICPASLNTDPADRILDRNPKLSVRKRFQNYRRMAWSPEFLGADPKASRTVRNILDSCGLDYRSTTVQELDQLDPRLVCLKCSFGAKPDGERIFSVLTWRSAVHHAMMLHWGDTKVNWQRLSDEDVVEAKILEAKEHAQRGVTSERIWRCIQCLDSPQDIGMMTLDDMRNHYDWMHSTTGGEIKEGENYYRALELPPRQPLSVKMILKRVESVEDSLAE